MPQPPAPVFQHKEFSTDAVYSTFRENIAKGYTLDQIRTVLEAHQLDEVDISSGLRRLLFSLSEYIKGELRQGKSLEDVQTYLFDHGYTLEVIKLALIKVGQVHH